MYSSATSYTLLLLSVQMGIIDKHKKKRKKGKFRRSSKIVKLSEEDLEFLVAKTKYSSDEINEWYRCVCVEQLSNTSIWLTLTLV